MLLFMNDYKGKWFILGDVADSMYGSLGTVDSANIDLEEHAARCEHYGIPMYCGDNEAFQKLCDAHMDMEMAHRLPPDGAHKATDEV